MQAWLSTEEHSPEENEIVLCYRDSPADAEWMRYCAGAFVDLHGNVWDNVSHFARE